MNKHSVTVIAIILCLCLGTITYCIVSFTNRERKIHVTTMDKHNNIIRYDTIPCVFSIGNDTLTFYITNR